MKAAIFLALLGLFLTTVFAETSGTAKSIEAVQIEGTEREEYYRPCPCKCSTGHHEHKAYGACLSHGYRLHCVIKDCKKGYHHGKSCCDKPKPKPSPPPSKRPKPRFSCPCRCVKRNIARHQCHRKPYCRVTKCTHHHAPPPPPHYRYGYYKPKPTFQCCYTPYYNHRY